MMRRFATLAVSLAGLAITLSPLAGADPSTDLGAGDEGKNICALIDATPSAQTIVNARQSVMDEYDLNIRDATHVVATALNTYCDQYRVMASNSRIFIDH